MVDKIDPTNQTSVEYGQSLLKRKYEQEEKFAEEARKDRKINYAMQVLSGVDNLIKDRARRNMLERNDEITQQIIREEAEFAKLQKEFELQTPWREANDPYVYATNKAKEDLAKVWKARVDEGLYGDDEKEYQDSVIALADNYYNKYQENKISALPFETKEEYTAELRAMLNKQAPSGLLDIALRGVGFRGNKQEELATKISSVQDKYKDRLRDRPGVKGEAVELSDEAKLALIQSPKQPLSKVSEITVKGKNMTVNKITDPETGEVTYTDIFGKKLTELDDLNIPLTRDEINRKVVYITKRYESRYGPSQTATIHSAIDNPNSPYHDLRLADELRLNGLFVNTFNVDTKSTTLKGQIKDDISTIDKEGQFNNEKILEEQTALGNRYALTYQLLKNGGTQEMYNNFLTRVSEDAIRIQQRGIVDNNGVLQPVGEGEALRLSHHHHATQGITKQSKSAGLFGIKTEEFYVYNYQPLNINQFDSEVPVQINRDKEGKPDSPEQINRDTEEVINSEEFQSKTPTEQKAILQNAADQGADINPDLLRPEGVQLELTGDEDFDSFRVANEMLLNVSRDGENYIADEGPTIQDAQEYLDREKDRDIDLLSPSRPEFRKLTREELAQQRKEEREASRLSRKEAREYARSPEGKAESEKKTRELEDRITNYVYDKYLDPQRNDIARIQKYVDGKINKNKKPGPNTTLGKALAKYGLEDMTREEIKRWLANRTIKTAYSPSDVRAELDKGNPVFVGDYRNVTKR